MATMQVKSIMDRLVPPQPSGMETIEPVPQPSPMAAGFDDVSKASQYTATTTPFDESKGVAGRVAQITDSGSALMQRAGARATEAAQSRGLRNSTMALQAGQAAMIDAATPIATADANLFQQQTLANQAAENAASSQNAQLRTSVGVQGLTQGEQQRQFGVTAGLEAAKLGEASRQFNVTSGLEEKKLGEASRQFNVTAGLDERKLAAQQAQFEQNLAFQRQQLDAQKEQFAAKLGLDVRQLDLQRDQLSQQDRQFLDEINLKKTQLEQQNTQFQAELGNKLALARMDAESRKQIAEIEAAYKSDIQQSQNVANAWGTMMQEIGKIQANPDIEAGAKTTLIQNNINAFQSFANFWKKMQTNPIDIGDLLNFGVPGSSAAPSAGPQGQPTGREYPPTWLVDAANRP